MEKFSWKNETELMNRLGRAQNALRAPIDIMTCVGFFDSREQLVSHVERYEREKTAYADLVMDTYDRFEHADRREQRNRAAEVNAKAKEQL